MKYINPIIKGFNPDPSICRVGEDYYLVTSSFEYFPGIPVYHSTDLVNWEHIGNCIEHAKQLPLDNAKSSGGVWAPTIRYNNGKFYVTATYAEKGNFIVSSANPAYGWSDAVWTDFEGIDPSIFFENSKMYYCANDIGERAQRYGSEGVSVAEMDPETGRVIGEIKRVWNGAGGGWVEAPHIYHIGEYYYIIAAEGGTGNGHHEVAARSKSIFGPYENCPENPILTNRNDTSKQISCSGHADLVDDNNGNWWLVHLGTRDIQGMSHLGRETFLMPVIWRDDWFFAGTDKKSHIEVEAPIWNSQNSITEWSADFSDTVFDRKWLWRRIPDMESYKISDGALIIKPSKIKLRDSVGSPSFMAVRPIDIEYSVFAELEFEPRQNGDTAGVVIYLSENFYYRLCKRRENDKEYIILEKQIADMNLIAYREEIKYGKLRMKIVMNGSDYSFYYSLNNNDYIKASSGLAKLLSTNLAGKCFTGSLVGVFAECDTKTNMDMRLLKFVVKSHKCHFA